MIHSLSRITHPMMLPKQYHSIHQSLNGTIDSLIVLVDGTVHGDGYITPNVICINNNECYITITVMVPVNKYHLCYGRFYGYVYYRPQRSWAKVIFSQACVKNSVHNRPYGHPVDMLILVGYSVTYGAVGTHYTVMLSCCL